MGSGERCAPHREGRFEDERVKIIVKDAHTGLYYSGDQTWSTEVSDAMDFDSINAAVTLALEEKLGNVNVVLRYEHPTCELALPLEVCVSGAGDIPIANRNRRLPP